jgi:hypothetical protein
VEGSDPANPGDNAILESPEFDAPDGSCVKLYYHMYGKHIGELNIYQYRGNNRVKICNVTGPQV